MYSRAKLLGHPIHPMLVGFPVAFYALTLVTYVTYGATDDPFWLRIGIVANLAGVITAAAAAIPGFIDWAFGIPSGHPAKATGLQHMLLNVGALAFFAIDAALQAGRWSDPEPGSLVAVALAVVGFGLTLGAGFLGWKLVGEHHVGVALTREQERLDVVHAARISHPTNRHV